MSDLKVMLAYARNMKVMAVRRPYKGATGVQFDVEHANGMRLHAVYRDLPYPKDRIGTTPFFLEEGLFSRLRTRDWWVYCLDSAEHPAFENMAKALTAALFVAQEHIRSFGVPTPLELDGPLTLEAAQEVLDAYAAFTACAGGR